MEENMFSINENKYTQMTDEMLIENVNKNDQTALNCLISRYNDIVNMKANKFFMIGAEKDDIIQEGMIGLYKAIKSFDTQKQNSFKTFANMCIERQLITAVKNSNRQKHIPLNSSISLNSAAYDDNEDMDKMEILDIKILNDPSDIVADREYYKSMENKIKENLSDNNININAIKDIKVVPYIYNMEEIMNVVDVIVARSGAMTITEISNLGKPSILVPLPNVSHDHQLYNAKVLEKIGAAKIILDNEMKGEILNKTIEEIVLDKDKCEQMSKNALKISTTNVEDRIYNEIMKTIGDKK